MLVAVKCRPVNVSRFNFKKPVTCKLILFAGKPLNIPAKKCCSYGTDCSKTATGLDCAIIPSPSKTGGAEFHTGFQGFCGGELGTAAGTDAATICCK